MVNTAAIYPVAGAEGELTEAQWAQTFLVNVTGNYLLARATERSVQRAGVARRDGAYQFRERGCAEKRERSLRHQQGSAESLDPGASHQD